MRNKLLVTSILLGIALVTGTLMFDKENDSNIASADDFPRNVPTRTPYPTSVPGVSAFALQKFARSNVLTTSAHGIEMSVANFRAEDDVLKVDVCFQKPSNENWLILDASIQSGNIRITIDGGQALEETSTLDDGTKQIYTFANRAAGIPGQIRIVSAQDGLPHYRCDTIKFHFDSGLNLSHFNLVIRTLILSANEGDECTSRREMVQSILDSKGLGIRIDCVKQEYGSFRSIAEKPASMSQEEAEKLVTEAFKESFMITGPWIFVGTVEQ